MVTLERNHPTVTLTSWENIKAAAKATNEELLVSDRLYNNLLSTGDSVTVTLKTGDNAVFDVSYDDSNRLWFVSHDCLKLAYGMNKSETNAGGWATSAMREYLNHDVFALLPDDLQAVIEPTAIKQVLDGEASESTDKLFSLSRTQVYGKDFWSQSEPDDIQMSIFKRRFASMKEIPHEDAWFWSLRTPVSDTQNQFWGVNANGSCYGYSANYIGGVMFGFCI